MNTRDRSADRRRSDARMLDTAEGVLVALRQCSIDDAFAELVHAAKRHHVPALTIARALVELAENHTATDPDTTAPITIARHEWGHLLGDAAGARHPDRRATTPSTDR